MDERKGRPSGNLALGSRKMSYKRRYLKKVSRGTGIQRAKREGWRAAEDMRGCNHYPQGSARHIAWQTEYDKTIQQINDDFSENWSRNDFA